MECLAPPFINLCPNTVLKPQKNGSTFFLRPYHGNSKSDFGAKYLREDTNVFNAEEGKLLIWPNFIYHGSHPYQGEQDRIIISANTTTELINK